MSLNLTAEELALEAMLESRLEIISARLSALKTASTQLYSETQALSKVVEARAKRIYIIEDYLLRLQGKPGLSNQYLVHGSQPRQNLGINNNEIEDIKMGVKTLRRKFQAAGAVVSTVGWWRHLKDKAATGGTSTTAALETTATTSTINKGSRNDIITKLSVDTSLANAAIPPSPPSSTAPSESTTMASFKPLKSPSPKTLLSPTSSSTKKRNTMDLQQIFTPPAASATTKQLHQHYIMSPSKERAHPSLGLISPPMSPNTTSNSSSLMRGLSLRS
ncbi:hypothetical protein EDD11_006504 [Mortierella claussenii]|nr:hypothetical protein EDD11_006504 [Mortierella claussenii]